MYAAGVIHQGLQNVTAVSRIVTLATVPMEVELFMLFSHKPKMLAPGGLCLERGLKMTRKINALEEGDRLYTVRQQDIRNVLVLAEVEKLKPAFGNHWYSGCVEMSRGRSDMALSVSYFVPNTDTSTQLLRLLHLFVCIYIGHASK